MTRFLEWARRNAKAMMVWFHIHSCCRDRKAVAEERLQEQTRARAAVFAAAAALCAVAADVPVKLSSRVASGRGVTVRVCTHVSYMCVCGGGSSGCGFGSA